jgi:hypothetical protein
MPQDLSFRSRSLVLRSCVVNLPIASKIVHLKPNSPTVYVKLGSVLTFDTIESVNRKYPDRVRIEKNGARGTRDIEGKVTRVGARDQGGERVSKYSEE